VTWIFSGLDSGLDAATAGVNIDAKEMAFLL
jgi:hypothetical protein